MPWFPELSIDTLISKGENDPRIAKHLPDTTEKKKPNKDFVWHVINYFQPEFIAQAIQDATKARRERRMRQDVDRPKLIVQPELLKKLSDMNLLRSKCPILSLIPPLIQRHR